MSRERELLERVLKCWDGDYSYLKMGLVFDVIRDFLASEKQDQPEPVAWLYSKGDVWAGTPVVLTAATTGKDFAHQEPHYDQKPLYLHPAPQRSFVRLSEEEVNNLLDMCGVGRDWNYQLICAVENLLARKNNG